MDFIWRLHYEDGSTFTDNDGEPWESPPLGVCLVVQPKASQDILATDPFAIYRKDVDRWMEVDLVGLIDQHQTFGPDVVATRVTRRLPSLKDFRDLYRSVVLEVRGK